MLNVKNIFNRLQEKVKLSNANNLTAVNWYYYLPFLASTILLLALLYIISDTFIFFINATQAHKSVSITSVSKPSANNVSNIPQLHLFGLAAEAKAAALTNLPLKLLGVLVQSPTKSSEAIISTAGEKEKIYHVGDSLPGGATLYAVNSDNVIIHYRGRLEKLLLNKTTQTSSTNAQQLIGPTENNQTSENLSAQHAVNDFIRNKMKDLTNDS